MILSMVLLVVVAIVVAVSLSSRKVVRNYVKGPGGKSVRHKQDWLEEVTIEDNNAINKVLIIEVNGVISSSSEGHEKNLVENISDQLKTAADDSSIRAVN